jgi:PhoPQ-activated pathogenicity-related protein
MGRSNASFRVLVGVSVSSYLATNLLFGHEKKGEHMSGFKRSVLIAILVLTTAGWATAGPLVDYVQPPDPSYTYEIQSTISGPGYTAYVVRMTSQTWRGIVWWHWLTIVKPDTVLHSDKALLFVDGGSNTGGPPTTVDGNLVTVAALTGTVVADVKQVPNQPLFGNMYEDTIIAYTFDRFLVEGDPTWPLLLPMVKSAVSAMDTVQAVSETEFSQEISGFVVTGGSKRGWTTWLTGAVQDPRVMGIAPLIIDVLNIAPQMQHQLDCYGEYSFEIEDYTLLHLQERMSSPEGAALLAIVDPYEYRDVLTLPKLILLGTNDPYWTVDAANLYFPDLQGEKYLHYMPNTGHDADAGGTLALAAFYQTVLTGEQRPRFDWDVEFDGTFEVRATDLPVQVGLWRANSSDRDFRNETWSSTVLTGTSGVYRGRISRPPSGWTAFYVELIYHSSLGFDYGLSTSMTVLPQWLPYGAVPVTTATGIGVLAASLAGCAIYSRRK